MYTIFDQVVLLYLKANHPNMRLKMNTLEYSGTPLMRPPLGHKILVIITRWLHLRGPQNNKMTQWFLHLV